MRHFTIIFLSILIFLFSCQSKTAEHLEEHNDYIFISQEQFLTEEMQIGEPQLMLFPKKVHFSGSITPLSESHVKLGIPVPGIIYSILVDEGEQVKKGQALVEIGGNSFIDMQRDFVEAYVMSKQLKIDYERAQKLFSENISTEKNYILAESSYKIGMAKYYSLKQKLENIGLNTQKIETFDFYSSYALKSPINGYVNQLHVTLGQYFEQQDNIAEIINDKKLQLKLNIFEKYVNLVESGQPVFFHVSGNNDEIFSSHLRYIGKSINLQSKTIQCYADLPKTTRSFVNKQFVEGDIIISADSVMALPESAFIRVENDYFLIILIEQGKDGYKMNRKKVSIGRRSDGYFELKEQASLGKILINGVYNIPVE